MASSGLSVGVTRDLTRDLKRRWGGLGYALATGRALWNMRPFRTETHHDGEVRKVRTLQLAIGNGRHHGGGMTIEGEAAIGDGRLDLALVGSR